jgi:hypothetical protein
VFRKLILAEQWPPWYPNSIDVVIHRLRTGGTITGTRQEAPVLERVGGAADAPTFERDGVHYPAARVSTIPGEGAPPELALNAEFSWTTFGIRVRSRVTEFVPDDRIAWTAHALGVEVYHRWFLRPDGRWSFGPDNRWMFRPNGGTVVVTEECEKGLLPSLTRWLMNKGLHAGHQLWVERLRAS